jgi:predicted nucleotidyltransferase
MLEQIKTELQKLEQRENIRILHAVESGSRAWGFASPDSDYDVRFIYVRPLEFYLSLEKTRDVIDWKLDEVLDINGWDLQKALRLLYRSNPTLFEWACSPTVYHTTPEWEKISAVFPDYFLSKPGLYHYLSTAEGNYREYLKGDMVRVKNICMFCARF